MPRLVRLYITQTLIGFGLSAGFVAILLGADVAGLRHLVTQDPAGPLAVAMLWLFNGIVFSGAQFGIAILRMADDGDTPRGGRRAPIPDHAMVPVPVRAEDRRDRRHRR
ncbi:hypothetical protein E0K89_015410 [Aquicoccus sp. SCR17]|nr:hypothetical protein [Carideicomes alvinocaridis]